WDATGGADWTPTVANIGRPSGTPCPAIGAMKNAKYSYPFPPNINFDFERGNPTIITKYNEAGATVSQTTFTYQRSYTTPVKIPGFKFDNDSTPAIGYAKYQVYAATSELVSNKTTVLYDLANTN